jgi:flagellar protein FlgJ
VAIKPPSDLVLDVATAAHPAKLREATEKLAKTGSGTNSDTFDAAMQVAAIQAASASAATASKAQTTPFVIPAKGDPFAAKPKGQKEALEKFEAYFVQTFVQEILPKDAQNVYGAGFAGDVWRSMLAEQIAAQIAHSSKFGIAARLADNHFVTGKANGGASSGALMNHDGAKGKNLPFFKDRTPADPLSGLAAGASKRS